MTPGRFWQRSHQIHPDPLEGHIDDGQRNERAGGRTTRRCLLAGRATTAEPFHFCIQPWPVETVPDAFNGVFHPEVPCHRMGMGQLHNSLRLGFLARPLVIFPPHAFLVVTVQQTISYFKMREGVWAREPVYLIYSAHLFPTVEQTVILTLLPAERTPGRDLLKHIEVDRWDVTGLTLTLPLSVRC